MTHGHGASRNHSVSVGGCTAGEDGGDVIDAVGRFSAIRSDRISSGIGSIGSRGCELAMVGDMIPSKDDIGLVTRGIGVIPGPEGGIAGVDIQPGICLTAFVNFVIPRMRRPGCSGVEGPLYSGECSGPFILRTRSGFRSMALVL